MQLSSSDFNIWTAKEAKQLWCYNDESVCLVSDTDLTSCLQLKQFTRFSGLLDPMSVHRQDAPRGPLHSTTQMVSGFCCLF